MKLLTCSLLAIAGISALSSVNAHLQMFEPIPRGDERNKGYGEVDYDLNAPLNDDKLGGPYPCKHQKVGPITARYTAGKSFNVRFMRGNPHKGGHCQFAISYDNGKNWVVIKTIIDLCFAGKSPYSYSVPLPKGAKNGKAILGWTWFAAEGNREYFMNCADIEISGGSDTGSLTGPEMLITQLKGYPVVPEWANTDAKKDGKELFAKRKVNTIPAGATANRDGTVVGEPCNGSMGTVPVPTSIDWKNFEDDSFNYNGDEKAGEGGGDQPDKGFFIATSSGESAPTGGNVTTPAKENTGSAANATTDAPAKDTSKGNSKGNSKGASKDASKGASKDTSEGDADDDSGDKKKSKGKKKNNNEKYEKSKKKSDDSDDGEDDKEE